jgi:hypothetical protein
MFHTFSLNKPKIFIKPPEQRSEHVTRRIDRTTAFAAAQ